MTLKEKIRLKILKMLGLVNTSGGSLPDVERETLINDSEAVKMSKLKEFNVWYFGDEDELLNFYSYGNMVNFNYEPYYSRNKKSYFWSISSTETDIKRTHSGQARNIVDTLVNILKFPVITSTSEIKIDGKNEVDENLQKIIKESKLESTYKNKQLPLTLIEGWGCYKINWDKDISDYPYAVYYKAENVDFVVAGSKVVGCVFKDYYTDGDNKQYLLIETRSLKFDRATNSRNLVIEKELFSMNTYRGKKIESGDNLVKVEFSQVPELKDVESYIEIGPMDFLFAVPSIFFEDTQGIGMYGRSIYTGKIGLFDDLDQCLSQAANAVRKSTPMEYFNTDFLERDVSTGMPKQPKAYDRKYTMYQGGKDADGGAVSKDPVQVTQPNINFDQYSQHAKEVLMQILNGIMSPATLGIDVAKKDNAEAQREKEKVTIFTRNAIIDTETIILKDLCNQLLCAYEFMNYGRITTFDYDITVQFSEFADESFENRLEVLSAAYSSEAISDKMYMKKLYGNSLSRAEYEDELEWLIEHHTNPRAEGMLGIGGEDGENLPGMFANQGVDTSGFEGF